MDINAESYTFTPVVILTHTIPWPSFSQKILFPFLLLVVLEAFYVLNIFFSDSPQRTAFGEVPFQIVIHICMYIESGVCGKYEEFEI